MSEGVHIRVTDSAGTVHVLEALEGYSVMEVIRDNGLTMKAECGGCLCCATCAVNVDPEWLPSIAAASPDETDLMVDAGLEVTPQTRLSCQIIVGAALSGLSVALLPQR